MNRMRFVSLAAALLVAALFASWSQQDATRTEATATIRLVQCALAGGCDADGKILKGIEGVRAVESYPSASEFDVKYDATRTTPQKIAETFNRENPGSRVEVAEKGSARSESRSPRSCCPSAEKPSN